VRYENCSAVIKLNDPFNNCAMQRFTNPANVGASIFCNEKLEVGIEERIVREERKRGRGRGRRDKEEG
jgi:hypothetical protein